MFLVILLGVPLLEYLLIIKRLIISAADFVVDREKILYTIRRGCLVLIHMNVNVWWYDRLTAFNGIITTINIAPQLWYTSIFEYNVDYWWGDRLQQHISVLDNTIWITFIVICFYHSKYFGHLYCYICCG